MADDPQDGVRLNLGQEAPEVPGAAPGKVLSPAARRALEEAAARKAAAVEAAPPPEDGGPAGPEPTRYGDWERKGIAVDF
ncbi:DUF1674 domain-containing protein [Caulobacter sp. NIBR1757]|uniref:DUF1674 domain-containing protein n=1 Tax=Caulobacter sp. NIBR1757 TaxID=3016000 RepID=UPI0022F117CC|nr:DUF1674 domain-containing protein [Caulobacter sp. NIBR1757]WGM40983.1 hypothetical protein AMEJIAPC_03930 [Caulobacter sp. NIBR1757]